MMHPLRQIKSQFDSAFDSDATRRGYLAFLAMYAVAYWGEPIFFTYLVVYFRDIGYSTATIGVLYAIGPAIALIAQPLWGRLGDRSAVRNNILYWILAGSGISMLLMGLSASLPFVVTLFIVHVFFRTSQHPVEDSLALDFLGRHQLNYGPIRGVATFGYMVAAVVIGWLMHWNIRVLFPLYFAYTAFDLLLVRRTPKLKGVPRAVGGRFDVRQIRNRWRLAGYVTYAFLLAFPYGFYSTFFALYLTKDLGGTQSLLGVLMFTSAAAEVIFLFLGEKLMRRFGINNLLLYSGIISLIRWILTYVVLSPTGQIWVQLLHGCSFMVTNFCLMHYIHESVPTAIQTSGQTLFNLIINGIARMIPSLLGGYLSVVFGIRFLFLINIWMLVAALVLLGLIILKSKGRPPQDALHRI